MITESLDPAQILAEHAHHVVTPDADVAEYGPCDIPLNDYDGPRDHCLPYRLAEALAAEQRQVTHSRAQIMAADQALAAERARVQRVEALHSPSQHHVDDNIPPECVGCCGDCSYCAAPHLYSECPTRAALADDTEGTP